MSKTYTIKSKVGELYKRVETATLKKSFEDLDDIVIQKDDIAVHGKCGSRKEHTVNVQFVSSPSNSGLKKEEMLRLIESHFGEPTKRDGASLVYRITIGIQHTLDGKPDTYFIKTLNIEAYKPGLSFA